MRAIDTDLYANAHAKVAAPIEKQSDLVLKRDGIERDEMQLNLRRLTGSTEKVVQQCVCVCDECIRHLCEV